MSKLDFSTIIIVALCVFALGFLIYKTVGLNKNGKADRTEQTTSIMSADEENDEYEYDDEGEIIRDDASMTQAAGGSDAQGSIRKAGDMNNNDQDEGMGGEEGSSSSTGGSNNNSSTVTTSGGNTVSSSSTSQATAAATADSRPTFYDDDSRGKYLVLAGAFRVKDNGIHEASRLRRLGYNDAEMTLMDRGTYATVLVDRFTNKGEAKALVSELSGKGIESYVMTKK